MDERERKQLIQETILKQALESGRITYERYLHLTKLMQIESMKYEKKVKKNSFDLLNEYYTSV